MSLGRRIDFEIARAIEWRAGALSPMPGSEEVESRLVATDGPPSAELAVERASRLLDGRPGRVTRRLLAGCILVILVLAAVAGAQVARLALADPSSGPVNIAWFLVHCLGAQSVFLLLTLSLGLTARRSEGGGVLRDLFSLGGVALSASLDLAARGLKLGSGRPDMSAVRERLGSLTALRPALLATSHGAWTTFNVALLLTAGLILSAEHHSFAWQSTFIHDEVKAQKLLTLATLPASVWPGLPDAKQIRLSRFDPQTDRFVDDGAEPGVALGLRQAWALQLLVAVAGWGFAPRFLLLLGNLTLARRAGARLGPPSTDPYVAAILDRLAPELATRHAMRGEPAPPEAAIAAPPETDATRPLVWWAASWLSAHREQSPVVALWGEARAGWKALPQLDGRHAETEALELLQPAGAGPRGLVLACDYGATPDASLRRLLLAFRERLGGAGSRLVIVLTGGDAFRATRLGSAPAAMEERRAAWEAALGAWGIPARDVIDFDAASATAAARSELADRLGLDAGAPSPESGSPFDLALGRVEAAAERWQAEVEAETEDREALSLRQAAAIRREIDECFLDVADEPGEASAGLRAAASAGLRRALTLPDDLPEGAMARAAGELAHVASLFSRLRNVNPRLVVAGLAVGLAAGPLGGALAAGTAGLLAGSSLAGTLGPLGAALGGALSLKLKGRSAEEGPAEPDESEDPEDRLGLPARAGVLRAILLDGQGEGEAAISRRIDAFGKLPATLANIEDAEDVAALVRAAREAEVS